MSSTGNKSLDQETTKNAGNFLFGLPNDESNAMDMRTRVNSDATMRMLLYYSFIGQRFQSTSAMQIKNTVERLLVSKEGLGREEAVQVLKQNFPKRVEIEKGHE